MKQGKRNLVALALAAAAIGAATPALAFGPKIPGMPSLPGIGGGSGGAQVDPAQLKDQVKTAVIFLVKANEQYLLALGLGVEAAKAKTLGDQLATGTLGAAEVKTATELAETTIKSIKEASDKGTKLSSDAAGYAAKGLGEHVSGTVAGVQAGRSLKSALQSPSLATISALGSVKEFPSLLTSWTSASGSVFSYLTYNGIDTAQAKSSIAKAMADD
jgi:hypothetical protein